MISSIDLALAKMCLEPCPYTEQELEAAELRVAARISERMLYGALSFDDEVRSLRCEAMPVRGRTETGAESEELATLCRTVIEQDGALHHMAAFLGRRIPQPDGARVLGCVLQLAGREDSARFWWQFAAGAGDGAAAYCLYLHHLALGEVWEAELWHKEADPESGPGLVLRVLARLQGEQRYLTAAAAAVVHYVPGAVQFVDEIELPLPAADFAQRIEELADTA
jgi:hypothetical protein